MKRFSSNKVISLLILLITLFLFYSNEKLSVSQYDLLGSKFFPRIVCIAIFFLSITLFFKKDEKKKDYQEKESISYKSVIILVILSFIYLLALNYHLGFLISSFFYVLILTFVLSNYKFKEFPEIILFSSISCYLIYIFFQNFLKLILP
mgnify:CR=1 FL=1